MGTEGLSSVTLERKHTWIASQKGCGCLKRVSQARTFLFDAPTVIKSGFMCAVCVRILTHATWHRVSKRPDVVKRHDKSCPKRPGSGLETSFPQPKTRCRRTGSEPDRKVACHDPALEQERHYATSHKMESQDNEDDSDDWWTEPDQPYESPEERTSSQRAIIQRVALSLQQHRYDRIRAYNNSIAHTKNFQNLHRLLEDALVLHASEDSKTDDDRRPLYGGPSETPDADTREGEEGTRAPPMSDSELSPLSELTNLGYVEHTDDLAGYPGSDGGVL